ncbi:UbiA family prenyltransferase [Chitinophagaceae bacterium LB-8]|uniref:UbiA family prenyltransferase n=1 Tax=Paraflavisolibacter caeni TaxID=2982496 RepID=A0A9X2XW77_9BACT|nr:UbiA family prenyltransferase [Paraflavisolibacter caeni]MCU7550534.1 UbiA family prenyltransferase [Paraflavisolibacter caeni]
MVRVLKASFDFFVFSSLYIAFCAVIMVWQSFYIFHLPVHYDFIFFVFAGSLCSYSFHWYLTPAAFGGSYRTNWSVRNKWLHLSLFLVSLVASVYYVWQLREHWQWLLATAFITFLYSAPKMPFQPSLFLRRIAIAKTIFLAYAWTHITAFLPLELYDHSWSNSQLTFVVNRFYLIYPICILFDYRDREEDRKAGIRSMITQFDERGVDIVFWGSMIAFFMTGILMYFQGISLPYATALIIPGILVAILYQPSKRNISDYFYYFILDGLMMLSALLLPLAKYFSS